MTRGASSDGEGEGVVGERNGESDGDGDDGVGDDVPRKKLSTERETIVGEALMPSESCGGA